MSILKDLEGVGDEYAPLLEFLRKDFSEDQIEIIRDDEELIDITDTN